MRRAIIVAIISLVVGAIVLLGTASSSTHNASATTSAAGTPAPADGAQAFDQYRALAEVNSPELLLPAGQRTLWIADWNEMTMCMHQHGVADFPWAPTTFGDGATPAPVIGGAPGSDMNASSTTFMVAQAACPFVTSNLNLADFQAAWKSWEGAHPVAASVPATPTGRAPSFPAGP